MGERGQVKKYGERIAIQFPKGVESQLKIFADMDGLTVNAMVRKLVTEGLRRRIPRKDPLGKQVQALLKAAEEIDRLTKSEKPMATARREKQFIADHQKGE